MKKALLAAVLVLSCASFAQTVPTANPQAFGGLCEMLGTNQGTNYVALGYGNGSNHCDPGVSTPNAQTDAWFGFGSQSNRPVNAETIFDGVSYGLTVHAGIYDLNNSVWGANVSCTDYSHAVTVVAGEYQVAYFQQSTSSVTVYDNGSATALTCTLTVPTGYSVALVQAQWFKQ